MHRSLHKAQRFEVIASDAAERAAVVARALIANSTCRLRPEDALDLFREPDEAFPRVAARHSPAVFTAMQAAWVDRALARARANRRSEPVRSLLLLLHHQDRPALPAHVDAAGHGRPSSGYGRL